MKYLGEAVDPHKKNIDFQGIIDKLRNHICNWSSKQTFIYWQKYSHSICFVFTKKFLVQHLYDPQFCSQGYG